MQERGFALLIVLWSVVFLSLVATVISASGQSDLSLVANLRSEARVEAAADGAIFQTLFHLLAPGEQRWESSGSHRVTLAETNVSVTIENLAGRVNPNTATPELMRELLQALGVDPPQAALLSQAIVDWRTRGESPMAPATARQAGLGAADQLGDPLGSAFQALSELLNGIRGTLGDCGPCRNGPADDRRTRAAADHRSPDGGGACVLDG